MIAALRRFARAEGIYEAFAVLSFRQELQRLSQEARVERFVAVIAEKRTKDAIRAAAKSRRQSA